MSSAKHLEELSEEQRYVDLLYETLDAERRQAASRIAEETANGGGDGLWQRDTAVATWSRRLAQLRAAEHGLCFGRVDRTDGRISYIGRIGLFDDNSDEPLLTDWRAPTASPFYCATPASPEDLERRRHFRTQGREVLDFHDDVFTTSREGTTTVGADSALIAALEAPRGSSMHDIVATIQAEQDAIIRLDWSGVLVIEGGPGTGKTAVALHRVAFLLYQHRERLSKRGVLVVGPNSRFLNYIASVLPSLGETDVVFCSLGELYPGTVATAEDGPEQERIKGDLSMVDALRKAVADRQELPDEPIKIELEDVTLTVDAALAGEARQRARDTNMQHNPARRLFREHLGALLVQQALHRIGDLPGEVATEIGADVQVELRSHADFHATVEQLWPTLTPHDLLAGLYTSHHRLAAAEDDAHPLARLYRDEGTAWTVSDIPLLDEAAEFLGTDTVDEQRASRHQAEVDWEYASGVLQIFDQDDSGDETLRPSDVVDPARLAERQEEIDHRPLSERAATDRSWTYGHLVVDEAQELSPMAWRVLMRRCPSRSATVVGDLAQRRTTGAAEEWSAALAPYVEKRWSYRRLSINYRTPTEIMAVADGVLRSIDPDLEPPTSVRHGDTPWCRQVSRDRLPDEVRAAVADETAPEDGRSVAVITTAAILTDLAVPEPAVALTPVQAKGLEFDVVIVVAPNEVLAAGAHGLADLYVTLTRPTRRLGILHTAQLPHFLRNQEMV